MNYTQLSQSIQDYCQSTETSFVANIPNFVQLAEERIYNSVQIPAIRKNVTGTMTNTFPYFQLPSDWLSTFSLAVIDPTTGEYEYLLNKDVNKGVTHMEMKGAGAATKGKKFVSQINLQYNGKVRAGWS